MFGTGRLCLVRCRSILKLFRGVGIGLIDVAYVMNCSFAKRVDLFKIFNLCMFHIFRELKSSLAGSKRVLFLTVRTTCFC